MARKRKKKNISINDHIAKVFLHPRSPASFRGPAAVVRALKDKNIKVDKKTVEQWLLSNDSYTLHKPVKHKFRRRSFEVRGIGCIYQADLMDLPALAKHNDGCRYLLNCLDTFSRMAYVRKLKNKLGGTVSEALRDIFSSSKYIPLYLQTDKGREFLSKETQAMLKECDVSFYTTENETKAMLVERFNRTLATALWRYMTQNDTKRYVDVLDDLVHSYNETYHSAIKCKPSQVSKKNEFAVWKNMQNKKQARTLQSFKYTVGDRVRISKTKHVFEKKYKKAWSVETFTVHQCFPTMPPTYELMDDNSEVLRGRFYESEMQKVLDKQLHVVEKILDRRRRSGRDEILIKYKNFDSSHNVWIPEASLQET